MFEEADIMNWIPCAENCVHQREGYCCLHKSGKASGAYLESKSSCIYYDPRPIMQPE